MSMLDQFQRMVQNETAGDPKRALPFGDYLTKMGIWYPARRASARAMLTRAMKVGGPLRDLVEKGLVLADEANRQPECFKGIERAAPKLPVVIQDGPVADLRTFPENNLTDDAREAKGEVVTLLTTVRMPVRYAEKTAQGVSKILFEVERQKLRADGAERENRLQEQHLKQVQEMYRSLVDALGTRKEAAE
jgi:hypothetical protein